MALLGQGATQAPHPVQSSRSICGRGAWPILNTKLMALGSQASLQLWHQIPWKVKQLCWIWAWYDQGVWVKSKIFSGQALAQSVQKVHSLSLKDTSGNPPSPLLMIWVSHTSTQAEQRVHTSVNSISSRTQGGLKALSLRQRKRLRRLWLILWVMLLLERLII